MKTDKHILKSLLFYSSKNAVLSSAVCLVITFLLTSCAQVVAPGGGKKDTTPPKTVKYTPDSAQVNFNSKSILITFDEFIQLKDLTNQLIVSPPLNNTPDITVKNKSLSVVFDKKDTLKPNTTYCISFGNAVQDITENNPVDNFKYIFSTGTLIDSCSLKGKVENGFNHTTEKGLMVMLYARFTDSIVYKSLPDYFAKTRDDGSFQINNIKEGKYKLVVLKDANANYKYDGDAESIGFIDAPVDVTVKKSLLIDLFQEPAKKLHLKKATYDSYGKILFVFNKSADSLEINPINFTFKKGDILLDYSKNKDSLTYWFRNIDKDVLKLQLKNGSKVMDTLEYKIITKEEALKAKRRPLKLYVVNNLNGSQSVDLNSELCLQFSQPIDSIAKSAGAELKENTPNAKHFELSLDDNEIHKRVKIASLVYDSTMVIADPANPESVLIPGHYKTVITSKENAKYQLFIPPATFTDFFGLKNDTIKMDFKTQEEKFYGTVKLKLSIPAPKGQYIVQLLDDKESVVRYSFVKADEEIYYEFLHPQQYKLKIIYDENENGKWDTGNYLQKIQPEKVIYYDGSINIRSNWDLDLEWKVTEDKKD